MFTNAPHIGPHRHAFEMIGTGALIASMVVPALAPASIELQGLPF